MYLEGIEVWIAARDESKDAVYQEYTEKPKPTSPKEELADIRRLLEDRRESLQDLIQHFRLRYTDENKPDFAHKHSTCYIEARTGTTFKIMIRIHDSFDIHNADALRLYVAIDNEWEFGYTFSVTKEELALANQGGSMVGEVTYDVDYDNGDMYAMRFAGAEEGKGKGKAQSSEPVHLDFDNLITITAQRVVRVPNDEILVLTTRSPALHASRLVKYLNEHRAVSQYVKPCLIGRMEKGYEIPPENWKLLGHDEWKQDRSIWWDPTGNKQLGRPYIFQFRYRSEEQLHALDLVSTTDRKEYDGKKDGNEHDSEQNKDDEEKEGSNKENEEPSGGGSSRSNLVEVHGDGEASSEGSWEEHELPPAISDLAHLNGEIHLSDHSHIVTATSTLATRSIQARIFDLESQDPGVIVLFQHELHEVEQNEEQRATAQRQRERHLTDVGDIVVLALAIAAVSSQMGIESVFDGFLVHYECSVEAKQQVVRMTNM